MGLPLIDGVFLTIVLTGGLNSVFDALMVGSFILGGGAVVAVILSEFDNNRKKNIRRIMIFSILVGIVAATQAAIAPTFEKFIDPEFLTYGAVLALVSIALRILPDDRLNYLLPPPVYIVLGFVVLSLEISEVTSVSTITYSLEEPLYAVLATLVSATICVMTVVLKPYIQDRINAKTLKYATSIGLIIIAMNILGIIPSVVTGAYFIGVILLHLV